MWRRKLKSKPRKTILPAIHLDLFVRFFRPARYKIYLLKIIDISIYWGTKIKKFLIIIFQFYCIFITMYSANMFASLEREVHGHLCNRILRPFIAFTALLLSKFNFLMLSMHGQKKWKLGCIVEFLRDHKWTDTLI